MSYGKQLKIIQLILLLCDVNGTLVVFPKDLNVTVGNEVRFPCSTDTNKAITWQYGKQLGRMADIYIGGEGLVRPYSKSDRHRMDEDSTTGRYDLIIKNVTKEDEGIYICSERASRDTPPQARLTVTGSYSNRRDDIVAAIDAGVSLKFAKCLWGPFYVDHVAVGKSHSDDVYNKNKLLNSYAQSGRFEFDDSNGMCELLITDVQEKDAGTYTCRENAGLGKRCDLELIVLDRNPECTINANDTESLSKTPATRELSCKVNYTGNREPVIEWKHDNDSHLNQMFTLNGREAQSTLVVSVDAVSKNCKYVCEVEDHNTYSNQSLQCFPSPDLCQELKTTEVQTTPALHTLILIITTLCLVAIVIPLSVAIYKCCKKRKLLSSEVENQQLQRLDNRVV